MHLIDAAHGSPWHRKAKAPKVFCGYKSLENSNIVMQKQRHNLKTPFQRLWESSQSEETGGSAKGKGAEQQEL